MNTYNPSEVDLVIDGYKVTGWKSVSIKRDSPSFTFVQGIRGKNTRVRNYNSSATLEVSIMQTSETNDILSEILRQDTVDPSEGNSSTSGCARLSISLKDRSGTSEFKSDDAYIAEWPSVKYAQSFEDKTWSIKCLTTNVFKIGGNLRPTSSILGSIFN